MQSVENYSRSQRSALRYGSAWDNRWTPILSFLFLLFGCSFITSYDPTSYKTATDLKAESLLLIEKATDPPSTHAAAIESLRLKLRQAYEYEAGKGSANVITVKQWKLLYDPAGNLVGGFLKKWETENKGQSPAFINGAKELVEEAFNEIIKLENRKVRD